MKTKQGSRKLVLRRALFVALFALCFGLPVAAQQYPAKPVRIMVGFVPGGGVDTAARIVAAALTDVWGTQVFVENRPGAAGSVATEFTAKAPPDGYTLMLCQIASHAITPARSKKLPYDHINDFAFPSMIGSVTNVFVVHPSMPTRNLREFIALAKARPGQINFGSSGVGASPHLSIELMKTMTGINIVHVPYKGAAQALSDVMSGHIESSVGNLSGALLGAVKAGRMRALGVTSAKRSKHAPEVPTFAEAAVPAAMCLARRDGLAIRLVTVWQPVPPLYDTSGWIEQAASARKGPCPREVFAASNMPRGRERGTAGRRATPCPLGSWGGCRSARLRSEGQVSRASARLPWPRSDRAPAT